jgi:hypothetical protein
LENFPRYLPNRRNQRTITLDCITRVKSTSLCRSNDYYATSTYLHTPSSLSRQETALYGRYELVILGIWLIMKSGHPSTRDQRRLRWDSYYIGFPGKPKENLTYRFTSHQQTMSSLIHWWISLLGIRFATSKRINTIT